MKLVALLLLLVAMPALARDTGFLNRTVKVAGVEYRYIVYVPQLWNKHQNWPVILFLHGAGERGDDGLKQSQVGLATSLRLHAERWPFIVVMPQCLEDHVWTEPAMQQQALAALHAAMKEFKGDPQRVYLSGLSMGGYGTWDMAAQPDVARRFAAYVVICGGVRGLPQYPQIGTAVSRDPSIADPYAETARRIGAKPVWIFHGSDDQAVPVEESRKMNEALLAAGGNVRFTEYPGTPHNSWDKAYAESELPAWLLAHTLAR